MKMKKNGNNFSTLFKKLYFYLLPTSSMRTRFITKHSHDFKRLGGGIFWQPRSYPTDPEFLSIGTNVKVASGVSFINHDIIHWMLSDKFPNLSFPPFQGCIEIGDNVMIGSHTIILPNVKIGSNVIIGAGSIVTNDIPDNSIAAGIPCKVVGDFQKLVEKRTIIKHFENVNLYWDEFINQRRF